jgi:hypothetical protein
MKTVSVSIKNGRTLPAAETWLIDETRIVRAKVQVADASSWLLYALSYSSKDRPAELVIDTAYASLGLTGMTEYNVYTSSTTQELQLVNTKFISFAKNVQIRFNDETIDAVEFEYKEGGFLTQKMYVEGQLGTDEVTTTTTEVTTTTTTSA